jgi:hypothetical protein
VWAVTAPPPQAATYPIVISSRSDSYQREISRSLEQLNLLNNIVILRNEESPREAQRVSAAVHGIKSNLEQELSR